ncbi:MAG: AAA family ATPase [Bacteroidia bacterium]
MASKFITNLTIKHFKSIENITLNPKRINVFIGKPNVGKSNVLEALSMFCLPYGLENTGGKYEIREDFIRYEIMKDFYRFSDVTKDIEMITNVGSLIIRQNRNLFSLVIGKNIDEEINELIKTASGNTNSLIQNLSDYKSESNNGFLNPFYLDVSMEGNVGNAFDFNFYQTFIKRYDFKRFTSAHEEKLSPFTGFLNIPNGTNLFALIQTHPKIREIANDYFSEYKLDFVLRHRENSFEIQRRYEGSVDTVPFSSTADTLQRMIFYKAAILSNEDSVLLFEEPESHTFPKYIDDLGELICESKTNQFFISTHSPYLIQSLLKSDKQDELAIFVLDYENYMTIARMLSDDEIQQIYDEGVDVFFNLNVFGVK